MYIKKDLEPKLVYASTDGRLLMVEICKEGEEILLANIYTPNEMQQKFYQQLKKQLI